jgi:hypothetical protein
MDVSELEKKPDKTMRMPKKLKSRLRGMSFKGLLTYRSADKAYIKDFRHYGKPY